MAELKSLDMSVLKSASAEERAAFGQKLLANFETSGFCKIVKHPIAGEDVSEIFKQVQKTLICHVVSISSSDSNPLPQDSHAISSPYRWNTRQI